MASEAPEPLQGVVKGIRDTARYLLATFGAIGAVLVGGLSLNDMFSGDHPVAAAIGLFIAVVALTVLIGLVIAVLTPKSITLGELAEEEANEEDEDDTDSTVVERLKADKSLFAGQQNNLKAFHAECVDVFEQRAEAIKDYLGDPAGAGKQDVMEARGYDAQVLNDAAGEILETAVLFKLEERFSPCRRRWMAFLALVTVVGIALFAWGSAGDSSSDQTKASTAKASTEKTGTELATERLWLEHLMATSGFRIERLDREAENVSGEAAESRINQAREAQGKVHTREEESLDALPATAGG